MGGLTVQTELGTQAGLHRAEQVEAELLRLIHEKVKTRRQFEHMLRTQDEQLNQCQQRLEEVFAGEAFRSLALRPEFDVGHGILADDPFHRFERLVYRAVERARHLGTRREDRHRSRQEEELRHILRDGGIELVFQPIHQLSGGAVLGFEALSRGPRSGSLREPRTLPAVTIKDRANRFRLLSPHPCGG